MIILIKMILKLLFMLDLRLGVIDKSNVKYIKKDKELISIAWNLARVCEWCMTKGEKIWKYKNNT